MPILLRLTVTDGLCRAVLDGADAPLAETPITDLPTIDALIKDPYSQGVALYRSLGGAALLDALDADDQGVLLLDADDASAVVPWEYAATPERVFLSCDYGLLRLSGGRARNPDVPTPPRLLVLCADPLIYPDGSQPEYRLDFPRELAALRNALDQVPRALATRRLPPTATNLRNALADGPAMIHLSCHGGIVTLDRDGTPTIDVKLMLEDEVGGAAPLLGRDLLRAAPRGFLRLVLLSACHSAPLARKLAASGVPVALGMQHAFPDSQSAPLAATFFRWLGAGQVNVAEAARQARQEIADSAPHAVGLMAVYVCHGAWGPLAVPEGKADMQLALDTHLRVPENIIPPTVTGLLGRDTELAQIARAFAEGAPAVTVAGFGGMGKTALAAAFLRRFGWRFRRVLGVTFASAPVDLARVCRELLERAGHGEDARQILSQPGDREGLVRALRRRLVAREEQAALLGIPADPIITIEIEDIQAELARLEADDLSVLAAAQLRARLLEIVQPGDLLLFDNFESVLTPEPGQEAAARPIVRLLTYLLDRGAKLLITSRARPVGLPGEQLLPSAAGLQGIDTDPAAELFLANAPRAQEHGEGQALARAVAGATDGYPLAVTLLAAAFQHGDVAPAHFLDQWPAMLAAGRRDALDERHATFATAVSFSLTPLSDEQRRRIIALAAIEVPFFVEAAVFVWGLAVDGEGKPTEEAMAEARAALHDLAERSLVEVDGWYDDEIVATYRFQPALRQELRRQAVDAAPVDGIAAYGAWLARRLYGEIGKSPALARLAQQSMPLLDAAAEILVGDERLWLIRNVAWLHQQFGDLVTARILLEIAYQTASELTVLRSAIDHELANVYVVQGQMSEAMHLYQESFAIDKTTQNMQGRSANLHAIANIYAVQGQMGAAMQVYQESLALSEALQDGHSKSSTLQAMASIYVVQGQLDKAMHLYQECLTIHEALQNVKGKSATLREIANIYIMHGQMGEAMLLYEECLAINDALQDTRSKSATLHAMANIYRVQGHMSEAMRLYQESLALTEALQDIKAKSATLHEMAKIFRLQGQLGEAIRLYQESLALKETLQDIRGKSATLHEMAYIYRLQGRLDESIRLYQEGLALTELLKDVQGKSATLHSMANIYRLQGKLDEAMRLYQESLALKEILQDIRGKSATLSEIANVQMAEHHWDAAEANLQEAFRITEQIGDLQGVAFNTVKLGQVAAARGDPNHALERYRKGLAIFERLGMPRETQQVREIIAELEGSAAAQSVSEQIAVLRRQVTGAVTQVLRDTGTTQRSAIAQQLNTLADRVAEGKQPGSPWLSLAAFLRACAALIKDQVPDLSDLINEDRAQVEAWQRGEFDAPMEIDELPEEIAAALAAGNESAFEQALVALPEEQRVAVVATLERMVEQQSTHQPRSAKEKIAQAAEQVSALAAKALRDEEGADRANLIAKIEKAAVYYAADEEQGSAYDQLAAYLRAVAALLRGEEPPAVPPVYADRLAALVEKKAQRRRFGWWRWWAKRS